MGRGDLPERSRVLARLRMTLSWLISLANLEMLPIIRPSIMMPPWLASALVGGLVKRTLSETGDLFSSIVATRKNAYHGVRENQASANVIHGIQVTKSNCENGHVAEIELPINQHDCLPATQALSSPLPLELIPENRVIRGENEAYTIREKPALMAVLCLDGGEDAGAAREPDEEEDGLEQ